MSSHKVSEMNVKVFSERRKKKKLKAIIKLKSFCICYIVYY